MPEKIDGCVYLNHGGPLFCNECSRAPPRSDKCTAFRIGRTRVMFEDDTH